MHAPVVAILTHVLEEDLEVSEALLGNRGAVLRHYHCGAVFGCCAMARSGAVRIVALHRRVDAVQLGGPAQNRAGKKVCRQSSIPTWSAGSPRNFATAIRKRWRGCATCSWPPNLKAISAAAKAFVTWIIVPCAPKSARRRS